MTTPSVPEPLVAKIRKGNRFLLTSHVSPDGDAIGSEIALGRMLRRMGKSATIWNRDPAPRIYRALPGSDRIHNGPEPPAGYPDSYSGVIVLECPSLERTGLEEVLGEMSQINIDHHLGNELYGEINWVDPAAPAVGEMIYRLAKLLKIELDQVATNALLMTLITDTGGFRFSNTTPETFDAAASLLRDGASPETVSQWLYESQPEGAVRLLGEMLGTLELHADGQIATARVTREMFERCGADDGDTEGLIDYPRSVAGVKAVALLRELADGGYKVSLRSRGELDVEQIASQRGGGGHRNAAGFSSEETDRQAVQDDAVEALREALADG